MILLQGDIKIYFSCFVCFAYLDHFDKLPVVDKIHLKTWICPRHKHVVEVV